MAGDSFEIELELDERLTANQQQSFYRAAARWSRCITKPLPMVMVDDVALSGLRIRVRVAHIDGPGKVWARGGPEKLRPLNAGSAAYLPATGLLIVDAEDVVELEGRAMLESLVCHEIGHVLGFGATVWALKDLLQGAGTADPVFLGPAAMREFGELRKLPGTEVPVENRGGRGVANEHWRESHLGSELMSSYLGIENALSRITLGALQDLGYAVDLASADPYTLSKAAYFDELPEARVVNRICGGAAVRPTVLAPSTLVPTAE